MAFFEDLQNETKLNIIEGQRSSVMQQMYVVLIRLGINPESFDPTSFTQQEYDNQGDLSNQEMLVDLISQVSLLDEIEVSITSATPSS